MKNGDSLLKNKVENVQTQQGKTWPQYVAVLTALFSIFNAGIHFGWPSPSVPKLLLGEAPYNVTREEASYITIIGPAGDVAGSILFPAMIDRIGRKPTILLIAVPQIISLSLIYLSYYSKILLYIARFIGGLSEAACFTILPIYIGEVTEPKVRGVLGSFLTILIFVGVLAINLVGSYLTIYTTALIFLTLPMMFLVMFAYMPETPYYCIMKRDTLNAEKSLQWLRRKSDVSEEMNNITQAVKRQMSERGSFKDLYLVRANRKACIVIAGIRAIQQLSGMAAMIMYMQVLFANITFLPKHISSSLVIFLEIVANFGASFLIDKAGRKPLLLVSTISCLFVLLFQGTFLLLKDFNVVDSSYDYIPIIGITLFMISWSIGLGSIVNVMVGEVFSASIKAKASSLMNIWFAILMSLAAKIFQYSSDYLGSYVPFFIFAVCQMIGVVFVWTYVPETKHKTLEEIQVKLRRKRGEKIVGSNTKGCDEVLLEK